MIVDRLNLTDFRNYASADVGFAEGANLIVGSNGQGKTNLVESLGYLSTLGSHRVSTDHAMIRQGRDAAIVRAQLRHDERHLLVEVQLNRSSANRAQVNRSPIKVRELPRYFSSVLFAPEDLALIRGEPAGRRRFLDELLVLRSPRLTGVFSDYDRVLRQRNSLLKSARSSGVKGQPLTTLDIWDERLVVLGSEIILARADLVAALLPEVGSAYVSVAGDDHHAELSNSLSIFGGGSEPDDAGGKAEDTAASATDSFTTADIEAAFRSQLAAVRRTELERGVTLVGPHRDDLMLGLNRMPAKGYASHGESWSFALSLKLASAVLLRRESSLGDPVLILDDVFAELDEHRRSRLAEAVKGFAQVLITAAVFDEIPRELTGHTVHIDAGTIVPASEQLDSTEQLDSPEQQDSTV
jgi:DNA replication and repair protein RecF